MASRNWKLVGTLSLCAHELRSCPLTHGSLRIGEVRFSASEGEEQVNAASVTVAMQRDCEGRGAFALATC